MEKTNFTIKADSSLPLSLHKCNRLRARILKAHILRDIRRADRLFAAALGAIALALVLILAGAAQAGQAEPIEVFCSGVHDGDTPYLYLCPWGDIPVRLQSADTPECASTRWPDQPGCRGARDYLASLIAGKMVKVYKSGRWSYSRPIVSIETPDGRNVSEALIAAGWAWCDPRYCKDPALAALAENAKRKMLGLWALPGEHIAPWTYRRQHTVKPKAGN